MSDQAPSIKEAPEAPVQTLGVDETEQLIPEPSPPKKRKPMKQSPAFKKLLIDLILQLVVSSLIITLTIFCLCTTIPALHARNYSPFALDESEATFRTNN